MVPCVDRLADYQTVFLCTRSLIPWNKIAKISFNEYTRMSINLSRIFPHQC